MNALERRILDPREPRKDRILLIERLDTVSLFWWALRGSGYRSTYFLEASPVAERTLRLIFGWTRRGPQIPIRLGFQDFPGSFVEAHEEIYLHSSDALFEDISDDLSIHIAVAFTGGTRSKVAVRKELLTRYTGRRTGAAIILRHLAGNAGPVEYIPLDSLDINSYLSPGPDPGEPPIVPRFFRNYLAIRDAVHAALTPLFLPVLLILSVARMAARGVCWSKPAVQHHEIGFDLTDLGLTKERGMIQGRFFLYDDERFRPSHILHVIRGHLRDEAARMSLETSGCPWVEWGRIRFPVSFFVRRILLEYFLESVVRGFAWCLSYRKHPAMLRSALAVMELTTEMEASISSTMSTSSSPVMRTPLSTSSELSLPTNSATSPPVSSGEITGSGGRAQASSSSTAMPSGETSTGPIWRSRSGIAR